MTITHWRNAVTGDFAKAGKWDDGRPGVKDDAVIAATGADYTVKVISVDAAHTLTLNSADATLLEKGHGSLHVGTLNIEAGTAVLTAANTIGNIVMTGGELEFSSGAALGDAAIAISKQAILAATASVEISNNIMTTYPGANFAVRNGATLKLDGELMFGTFTSETLNFIGTNPNGKGDGTGIIDVDGTIGTMSPHTLLMIKGVTLGSSIANNGGFDAFLSNTQSATLVNNGGLDLTGQNNVVMHLISDASAHVINSGPLENFTLNSAGYSGEIQGDFSLTTVGSIIGGTIALDSGDQIHVIGGTDFSGAHFEGGALTVSLDNGTSGGSLVFANILHTATFSGTAFTADLGTGQNTSLAIDHTFAGAIVDFGGHNGGTDHIIIPDEQGNGAPTLQYEPDEAGTGGQLVVTFANEPAFSLNLVGHYTQGDFTVHPSTPNEIDCSAEQSAPHVPAHIVDALI
ncbi:MAG TPA: hypothetical protein VGG10_06900 [Rhizomicrobium sp.]